MEVTRGWVFMLFHMQGVDPTFSKGDKGGGDVVKSTRLAEEPSIGLTATTGLVINKLGERELKH